MHNFSSFNYMRIFKEKSFSQLKLRTKLEHKKSKIAEELREFLSETRIDASIRFECCTCGQ